MEITANIAGRGLAQIAIQKNRISAIRFLGPLDSTRPFVSPGFVDLQINGFAGIDFSDPDLSPDHAASILPAIWGTGVTTFCATLVTNTIERLERNFRALERARRSNRSFAATVPCYHLEGPYLSPGESHGAHDPALMRLPDWNEFEQLQEAAGGNIAIITLAPELPGAYEFIRRATSSGVVVALGHTDGLAKHVHKAIEAGAKLSTHLGNGCPTFVHRHENPIWAQIASDQLQASLICDGFHLPADLVRVISRVKGVDRCILVSDAVHVASLPPGRYSLVGMEIELLPKGQVVTSDRRCLAGSSVSMPRAISIFMEFTGARLHEALRAATTNPARLLHRFETSSELAAGELANLTLFRLGNRVLEVETVILGGQVVYSRI